jgi:hypothetical protein
MIMLLPMKKKPKPKRKRATGEVYLLNVEISALLQDGLRSYCAATRRTRRAAVELALEALLQSAGFWPPSPGGSAKGP